MADLTITATAVALVKAGDHDMSLPAAEALTAGQAVGFNTSSGQLEKRNATSSAEALVRGVCITTAAARITSYLATRGALVDLGAALDAMNFGAPIFLSNTDGTLADASVARNEVQTLTESGSPTGGSCTVAYGGQTSATIAFDATAATIQTALENMSSIRKGNILTGGGPLNTTPVTVTFTGELGNRNIAIVTVDSSGLTGGSAPAVTPTETTAGRHAVVVGRVVPAFAHTTAERLMLVDPEVKEASE